MNMWRYLDLAKLAALLQSKSLHFSRGDKFGDSFEGSYPLKNIHAFGKNDNGYNSKEWKKFVAVSCWYENDIESDAMWRLYTSNKQGVAIKTSWNKLKKAVESDAYLKKIEYIDFTKDEAQILIPTDVFKYKRKAYIHENEVRAIITKYPKMDIIDGLPLNSKPIEGKEIPESGLFIEIDLPKLIEKIVVSPYSPPWFTDVIKEFVNKYELPKDIVIESELKIDPVYAKI